MKRAIYTAQAASVRLAKLTEQLGQAPAEADVLVLGASFEAAAEVVRGLRRPLFGWRRLTLFRAAAELARPALLDRQLALAGPLALEALWARVAHQLHRAGRLGRFEPLHGRPGLARALHRTVEELRLANVSIERAPTDLRPAYELFVENLTQARLADAATVYQAALGAEVSPLSLLATVDLPKQHVLPRAVLERLGSRAQAIIAVAPQADAQAVAMLEAWLQVPAELLVQPPSGPIASLQHNLFSKERAGPAFALDALFSAPGEVRECVEIARRVMLAASAGTPFDRMAVSLRSPGAYRAPLEEAFRRAGVPYHFARGVLRPDPGGRSLLALLRCAEEGLSARRFSEYLSLGQLPKAEYGEPPVAEPSDGRFARPDAEQSLLPLDAQKPVVTSDAEPAAEDEETPEVPLPVVHGQLRAPRKWELLINDAAVIGGARRWRDRLDGLKSLKETALRAPDLTEAQTLHLQRELADVTALAAFALPLIDELASLPAEAPWGTWVDKLGALATRALRHPERVLRVLADLAPMAEVGPVAVSEVRAVLMNRLSELVEPPTNRRFGKVFVAPADLLRGLQFDAVFVPGLAERVFPQKVKEDPLLPDLLRRSVEPALDTNDDRVAEERLALQLSVGAAVGAVTFSYPRIDAEHARPRVPSFYALEAVRAVEGVLLPFEQLQRRAERAGHARLAWPAPKEKAEAIDDTEFDLAVLEEVLSATDDVTGRARYLLGANAHLARALRARHMRWESRKWQPADGLVAPAAPAREALVPHQFAARAFSPTALEQYAACPYRFFLSAIHRLEPLEIPGEIEELGPLEKGSMAHEVLFRLLSELQAQGQALSLPQLEQAIFTRLDEVLAKVSTEYRDQFVPAIERVWHDGVESLRADLREVLRTMAKNTRWAPWRFELSYGLATRELKDSHSIKEPVQLDQGLKLRGSIDLVERATDGAMRATDYKTGKAWAEVGNIVGGGRHLQPVLYALALEKLFPDAKVEGGRLWYCTQAGGFTDVPTPLNDRARELLGQVVLTIRTSLEHAFFPAAPDDGECRFCNYLTVCGPEEERRTRRKARAELKPLDAVRRLP